MVLIISNIALKSWLKDSVAGMLGYNKNLYKKMIFNSLFPYNINVYRL